MSDAAKMSNNSTVLELLQAGGSVALPNGVILKGDPNTLYIEIGHTDLEGEHARDGLWNLSEDGLADALKDADQIASCMYGEEE